MNKELVFEKKKDIEWITFNNPSKANCLSRDMLRNLISHFQMLKENKELRTVILTGAGVKSFSAGMDINEFKGLNPQTGYELISELKHLCGLIRKIPQVVIVVINGYCIGAAMEIAMAADIRVASTNAVFIMPEIKLGIPSVLDSVLLQKYVGLSLAKEMLLIGDPVSAGKINQHGFINALVEIPELRKTAEDYAYKVNENHHLTTHQQKLLFEMWQNTSLEVAIQDSMNQFALSFGTEVPAKEMERLLAKK